MRTSGRSNRPRHIALLAALLVTVTVPLAGYAQNTVTLTSSTPYAEPAEMLARLKSGQPNISVVITAAFGRDRQINDSTVLLGNYDRYTDAERRRILDGVERIMEGAGELTADQATMEAFRVLSSVARDREHSEAYEIPDRLLRIYEDAGTASIKRTMVDLFGQVLRNSPLASPRIIKLLVSLVNQPVVTRQQGYHGTIQAVEGPVHPDDALDALLSACEAGVPVLRQLQANRGAIKHDAVRTRVDSLAREGFALERMRLSSNGMNPCTPDQGR